MSVILKKESGPLKVWRYETNTVRSPKDLDLWFSSVLMKSGAVLRRLILEDNSNSGSEGGGSTEFDVNSKIPVLSEKIREIDADFAYFYFVFEEADITVSVDLRKWIVSLMGKKKFAPQMEAFEKILKLNE